ncbi:alpha/beta hydrolase fold [Glycomyces sambucus]|uniref:Alpha/beta hydrolase fold n=1 Tax=Glycomyces sambucus TaxID=380244 RepID=A0A1G9F621_9ACTN|nr:alpha/beta hydrolase [Glycomyces sambucus]SDK83795.1 alpha/beta hydrolase fold [Glycomyces sambucus]
MRRTAVPAALACTALACAALAGCGADFDGNGSSKARAGVADVQDRVGSVDWGACDRDAMYGTAELTAAETAWAEALECGSVRVPVDYEDPGGLQVRIAMVRHPATGADRTGSLLVNPGGPGGSGIALAQYPFLPEAVTAAFDVVGFDPRGTGASAELACGSEEAFDAAVTAVAATDPAAVTDDQSDALKTGAADFSGECAQESDPVFLEHIGTMEVARDLEVMRAALGDDGLTYLGYSYGTYIGQLYLYLYPDRVRAMVFDGVMRTTGTVLDLAEGQAAGFEAAWRAFVAHCLTVEGCPFTSAATADAELTAILTRAQAELAGSVTVPELLEAVSRSLYSEAKWTALERVLAAAADGSPRDFAADLRALAGGAGAERGLPRPLPPVPLPQRDADADFYAVQCADRDNPGHFGAYADSAQAAYAASPLFGAGISWSYLPCATWSADEPNPSSISGDGAPTTVLVGNTGDPATPYAWAQAVAGQLDAAVLVTYEGSGHTAYALGHACVDGPVTAYLTDLTVPEQGLRCPQELD